MSPSRVPSAILGRSFGWLWAGQAVSEVGSGVTAIAVPLAVLLLLHGSAWQVAMLTGITGAASIVAAPAGGLLTDRLDHRLVLVACDAGRLALVVSLPVTAAAGALTLGQVYAVTAGSSALNVIFGITYHSFYPHLVGEGQLTEANSRIASTEAVARGAGPAVGGALVGALGVSRTVLVDAASFAASLYCLTRVRPHRRPEPDSTGTTPSTVGDGFAVLRADLVLNRLVTCTVLSVGALAMSGSVIVVFLNRDLKLSPAVIGIVFAAAEVAGVAAAVFTPALSRRLGSARLLMASNALLPAGYLVLLARPDAPSALTFLLPTAFMALWAARFVTFDVLQYTYRQTICPAGRLGRLNAAVRTMIGVATMVGALLGGVGAEILGTRLTIALATTLACLGTLSLIIGSPVQRRRDLLPEPRPVAVGSVSRSRNDPVS